MFDIFFCTSKNVDLPSSYFLTKQYLHTNFLGSTCHKVPVSNKLKTTTTSMNLQPPNYFVKESTVDTPLRVREAPLWKLSPAFGNWQFGRGGEGVIKPCPSCFEQIFLPRANWTFLFGVYKNRFSMVLGTYMFRKMLKKRCANSAMGCQFNMGEGGHWAGPKAIWAMTK